MLIRDKKDWNRYLKKKAEKLKPPHLKEIEKAFRDGTARTWSKDELYGVRAYLDRLSISFETDMEKGMMKAATFSIKPFKGIGKLFSANQGSLFAETMKKAAEFKSGTTAAKNPKAVFSAASKLSGGSSAPSPTAAAPKAAAAGAKTPGQKNGKKQQAGAAPPSIKVMILSKLIDLCIWLMKQGLKFIDEIALVNKEVAQVQASAVRVRSKF